MDNKVQYEEVATTKKAEVELKESDIRDTECASCRFIPCNRPNEKSHGVPYICLHPACPHSRSNKFIHSFYFFETFGEVGFHFFDIHRNVIFGFASILTLLSTALFLFGVSAFSNEQKVVSFCNWAKVSATYVEAPEDPIYYKLQFGLNAMVVNACASDTTDFSKCQVKLLKYTDSECDNLGFIGDFCTDCGNAATAEATGAAFTAVSKLISLGGMQRRMYSHADSPSFKILAIVLEIVGAVSLLVSLLNFKIDCINSGVSNLEDKTKIYSQYVTDKAVNVGSAYIAYAIGVAAALVRLIAHILVPLPHRGKGLLTPFLKLFTRCDGCCVLYEDEIEEEKRKVALGINSAIEMGER